MILQMVESSSKSLLNPTVDFPYRDDTEAGVVNGNDALPEDIPLLGTYVTKPTRTSKIKSRCRRVGHGIIHALLLFLVVLLAFKAFGRTNLRSIDRPTTGTGPSSDYFKECIDRPTQWTGYGKQSGRHARSWVKTTFNFSTPDPALERLFFFSKGNSDQFGTIHITEDREESNVMRVEARVKYDDDGELRRLSICGVERGEHEHGVGIYMDNSGWRWPWHGKLDFEIIVYLPAKLADTSSTTATLYPSFHSIQSDLENFAIHFHRGISFKNVLLRTTNGPVSTVDAGLSADFVDISTTNRPVWGKINWTDHGAPLAIRTTNNNMGFDIGVIVKDPYEGRKPAEVILETTNWDINATFRLLSPESTSALATANAADAPSYKLTTKTTNGPLHVRIASQPPYSTLDLSASTSNAPASINLGPAYEGHFAAYTSNRQSQIYVHIDSSRPEKGQHREIEYERSEAQAVVGEVVWYPGDEGGERGHGNVQVSTSNADVDLFF